MSTSRTLCFRGACHLAACVARARGAHGHSTAAFSTSAPVTSKSAAAAADDAVWAAMTSQRREDGVPIKSSPASNSHDVSGTSGVLNGLDSLQPDAPAATQKTQHPKSSSPASGRRSNRVGKSSTTSTSPSADGGWNPAFDGFLDQTRTQGNEPTRRTSSRSGIFQGPVPRRPHPPSVSRTSLGGYDDWDPSEKSSLAKTSAFDLFNEVVQKDTASSDRDQSDKLQSEQKAMVALQQASMLPKAAAPRLDFFRNKVWPHIQASRTPIPTAIYKPLTSFLSSITSTLTFRLEPGSESILHLAEVYDAIGKYDLRERTGLILILCNAILYRQRSENPYRGQVRSLTVELIKMWMAASQMLRPSERGQDVRWALPTLMDVNKLIDDARHKESKGSAKWPLPTGVYSSILNQFPTSHARYAIPGLLMTLAVLSDQNSVYPKQWGQARPLLELSRHIFQRCPLTFDYVERVFLNPEDIRFVKDTQTMVDLIRERWPKVEALLADHDRWRPKQDGRWRLKSDSAHRAGAGTSTLAYFHKALRSAHTSDNTGVIVSLWLKLKSALVNTPTLEEEMRSDPEFLDFWHFVWCSTRRPDMLQETQKMMAQVGLEPTIKTFTAMMHGWKLCKDGDKIEALWDSLANSSIQLDIHAWTERISGLIELGQPQRGIEVLAEMFSAWEAAVGAGKPDQAVQPTIEVINAAFKPLIRTDKKAAHDILSWAGLKGIHPDVLTYNILLRESLRQPHGSDDVQTLLKGMSNSGIQPDAATFTIILEEALGRLHHSSSEEQVAAINQVTQDINLAGIRPNQETYGKMLHAVASLSNGSDEAVETVIEHMRASGHTQISPHMVLILINRIVKRGQRHPQIIEDLLHKHGFKTIQTGDQRLWENVLRVYATLGDQQRAMSLYDQLRKAGRPVTSQFVLRDMIVELIEKEEVKFARRIVNDTLTDMQKQDVDERRWRAHFWHQAYRFGLLDWEQAPPGLQKTVDEARYRDETGR